MKNKEYKQQKLKEFRNKFGGDVWLGADRKVVEDFLSSLIDEILECLPEEKVVPRLPLTPEIIREKEIAYEGGFNSCLSQFLENLNNKIR